MPDPSTVQSREDLVRFISELRRELDDDSGRWENDDVSSYLEALAGWTADMPGWFENQSQTVPDSPTWSLFASMLLAATAYE